MNRFIRLFLYFLLFLMAPPKARAHGEECRPQDHVCIPEDVAAQWRASLLHQHCMEESLRTGDPERFALTFPETYRVIISKEGQVFDQEIWKASLLWCDYEIEFLMKPNLRVLIKEEEPREEPTWGIRLRVRLALHIQVSEALEKPLRAWEPAVMAEPLFWRHWHVGAYVGPQTFGAVIGMDLTRNLNVYGGYGVFWDLGGSSIVLGVSLSFN